MEFKLRSKVLAEFVGTYFLMLAVGLNSSGFTAMGTTSIAFTLMVSIYALADISGAHFNPAVSFCLLVSGKLPAGDMALYWLGQFMGALLGTASFEALSHEPPAHLTSGLRGPLSASMAEVFFTCMLCFVVLNVACTQKTQPNQIYGLAIGLAVVGGGPAAAAVEAGCLNPAVALGLACTSIGQGFALQTLVFFMVGELLGAALAAGLYRYFRPEEFLAPDAEEPKPDLMRSCLAEFVGTFYLVLTVGLNALHANIFAAWYIAATLACMVYCFATISGAHLNPSVSLALVLRGAVEWRNAAAYVGVQLLAGIVGAVMAVHLASWEHLSLGLGAGYYVFEGSLAELLFTFLLAFVVLNIASVDGKSVGDAAGLAVGSCVTAGGFAVGRISGASFNPAVSLGLAVVGKITSGPDNLIWVLSGYLSAELFAGALAAGVFSAMRMGDDPEVSPEDEAKDESTNMDTLLPPEEAEKEGTDMA